MLEFKIRLDVDEDLLTIDGPTDLKLRNKVYSIEDMCELFRTYLLRFCKQVHFEDYRIDKTKNNYQLSKDINGTRSEWAYINSYTTYFEAFEALCDAQYADDLCPMGYIDCIHNQKPYNELCKDCVSMDGYYYDDEDK